MMGTFKRLYKFQVSQKAIRTHTKKERQLKDKSCTRIKPTVVISLQKL